MTIDRAQVPCWSCGREQAADARHFLANATDADLEAQRSPSGWPLMCCRVRLVGVRPPNDRGFSIGSIMT